MAKLVEMDSKVTLRQQMEADLSPVVLINPVLENRCAQHLRRRMNMRPGSA
jgi:hypothetical protein